MKIFIPLVLGLIVSMITGNFIDYDNYIKPLFYPDNIVFPIVWSILYLLMGLSSHLIEQNNGSLKLYYLQLIINLLWPFMFSLSLELGLIWIIILIIAVILMMIQFYKINKTAFYLQIPYLIWLLIAFYLNLSLVILN